MTLVAAIVAVLYGVGVFLLLQRTLTRIIIGLAFLSHGANLMLLVAGGRAGLPPLSDVMDEGSQVADPVPQALALTAIVITFGITVFLLALAYRSYQLTGDDEVEDDLEDRRIVELFGRHEAGDPASSAAASSDDAAGGDRR
ncbi:Na(+)/H(+) antiporter subunit C [Rhabdothermincola salaria]|uniref:Na(+)/H(+) antiporter subunit C n=1 Tax=Rhabdothermincola salaria TaxID=2903142 RepID=UPI001E512D6F|nr:Na(+)/H(+) antiporter subunit C [Rhabdothermincola salaria]MCD9624635.1 Na(+)/H(+) antiporter subunit C [Rhabdothermincola salaria]